ncbi:MAG: PQQ-binding-like beta-propeller repeat protein [Gammaproteobacteria bacterium]|nr:PQQ-binding-like beta-propeller repeat protein [Gammaproteobacteria bacterium]
MNASSRHVCLGTLAPLLFSLLPSVALATDPAPDGAALYQNQCAACHDNSTATKAPGRQQLADLEPNAILAALRDGTMRMQGSLLDRREQSALISFLTGREPATPQSVAANGRCSGPVPAVPTGPAAGDWNGWGGTVANARHQAAGPHLTGAHVNRLRLRWAYGFAGASQARSQPAVLGNRLFVVSATGRISALDADSGCTYWTADVEAGVRSAISIGSVVVAGQTRSVIFFSDARANAYALDAQTGKTVWQRKLDPHRAATGTGSVTLHRGVLYVPLAGLSEEAMAGDPNYECCSFRGSVSALDAATGEILWRFMTTPEPTIQKHLPGGKKLLGPAGISIWSAPTVDAKRGLLYVATGNSYSGPAQPYSNAIVALDIKSGAVRWARQTLAGDIWIYGCDPTQGGDDRDADQRPNCPQPLGPDLDFAASTILVTAANGKDLLVATQKSGMGYALDPDRSGEIVWQYRWGKGAAPGAVWGATSDGRNAYFAVADQNFDASGGGMHAVDLISGRKVWFTPPEDPLCAPQSGCSRVQSAALTSVPGVVFSAAADGGIRAYAADTGRILWRFDTNREFATVNGAAAHGGSIDGPGQIVANDMLYVTSGNSGPFGRAGNVLLAFAVEQEEQQ